MRDREGERLGYVVAIVTIWWVWTVSPWHSFHHIEPLSLSPLSLSLCTSTLTFVYPSLFSPPSLLSPDSHLVPLSHSFQAAWLPPPPLFSSGSPHFCCKAVGDGECLMLNAQWSFHLCPFGCPSIFLITLPWQTHLLILDLFKKKKKEKKKRGGENSIRTARRAEQKLDWYLSANLLERLTSSVITI